MKNWSFDYNIFIVKQIMKIRLTEGDLIKLVNRVINENYFDSNFYLNNIKLICESILEDIKKYKKVFAKMPKKFKSKYVKEDYFRELLDILYSLDMDMGRLNSNFQSLFGKRYSLNDYLNESSNRDFLYRETDKFYEVLNGLTDFILGIQTIFETQELDEIKRDAINIWAKLIDYRTRLGNYYEFIGRGWSSVD